MRTDQNDPKPLGGVFVGQYPYFGITVRTYGTNEEEGAVVVDFTQKLESTGYVSMAPTVPRGFAEWRDKRVKQWRRGTTTVRLFFEPTPYVYSRPKSGPGRTVTREEAARVVIVELDDTTAVDEGAVPRRK